MQIIPIIATMDNIKEPKKRRLAPDFIFAICNGIHYTKLDQFVSLEARNLYVKSKELRKNIIQIETKLSELRSQYAKSKGTTLKDYRPKFKIWNRNCSHSILNRKITKIRLER